MKIDSLFVYALIHELSYLNDGARIEKIHQPTQYEVLFNIRTLNGNKKLLFSIHPETFRFHETTRTYENPKTPKSFCVVLRKYIESGKIIKIEQLRSDRHIKLTIETYDAVGDFVRRYLYLELMGKHSNLILTDENDMIIDALKRVDIHKSEYREVLPKLRYVLPRETVKADTETFSYYIQPIYRTWLEKKSFNEAVLLLQAQEPKGYFYQVTTTKKGYVSFFDISEVFGEELLEKIEFARLSEVLDYYFHQTTTKQQLQEKVSNLLLFVQKHYKKNQRKKLKLEKELKAAEDYEKYQKMGNLLLAQQHLIQKNMTEIEVEDYFSGTGEKIVIPLKPLLTATQNAQSYFKRYTKSKKAIQMLHEQIEKTTMELLYFETILQSLEQADLQQAVEIRSELEQQGYLKVKKQKERVSKQVKYMSFRYNDIEILVGRNNLQNDYVTFKKKRKGYTWLHVKDFPGSHVLICERDTDPEVIEAAAMLAAYYSKMQTSENVAVDYTEVQNVSKPSGAKPGFVIYREQKTIHVTPNHANMKKYFPTAQF